MGKREPQPNLIPRFDLGPGVATPGALEVLGLLLRRVTGDWDDLAEDEKQAYHFRR